MTYEIKAQLELMESSASEIETNATQIQQEVQAVDDMLRMLRQSFLGQRASAFFRQYDQAYETMQEWHQIVNSFAQELRADAARLRRADTED